MRSVLFILSILALVACSQQHRLLTKPAVVSREPVESTARYPAHTAADAAINQSIRRKILSDETMSVNAQNIVIQTDRGRVTLRGAVDDEAERAKVLARARQVSGIVSIDNQLLPLTRGISAIGELP